MKILINYNFSIFMENRVWWFKRLCSFIVNESKFSVARKFLLFLIIWTAVCHHYNFSLDKTLKNYST